MDMQISVNKPSLVVPSQPTEISTLYLHNIDQQVFFNVEMVFFYTVEDQLATEHVVDILHSSLAELLVPYHFAAGRYSLNEKDSRLEVVCNRAGALFAGASSKLTLSQLGDITAPNPAFRELLLYPANVKAIEDIPLLTVQVTRFSCGGFAVGFCVSHVLLDGIGMCKMFSDYARIARAEGVYIWPSADRSFLKPRTPPQLQFVHNELLSFPDIPAKLLFDPKHYAKSVPPTPPGFCFKTFAFTPRMLDSLKKQVASGEGNVKCCSAFEAVTALVWQAKTKVMRFHPDEPSKLFIVMDVRKKFETSSTTTEFVSNTGNTIVAAPCVDVSSAKVCENPLSFCVEHVQKTIRGMTEDYVRSHIDWCEVNHGIINLPGAMLITTWSKLGFEQVDFGWGKPQYVAPMVNGRVEYVLVLSNCQGDGGVNVFMAMEVDKMNEFEKHLMSSIYN